MKHAFIFLVIGKLKNQDLFFKDTYYLMVTNWGEEVINAGYKILLPNEFV